jgi:hypothetical protein
MDETKNDGIQIESKNTDAICKPNTKKEDKKLNFLIGADPEFALTSQGRKIDARQTLQYLLRGKKEFREMPDNGRDRTGGFIVGKFGNVGWDNHTATAEVRPEPAETAQGVVNNIAGVFKELIKYTSFFDLSTISEFGPIGGHIHFEIPKGMKLPSDKVHSIHRKLSSFYLPIMLSENKTNLSLRINENYGMLKDYRLEERFRYPDGNPGYTYEFRCPSAEWLTTPKIATATMGYLATIWNEIINNPKAFSKLNDIVYKNEKQGMALQTLALMEYDLLTNQILNKTKKYIKDFELYPKYKNEIDYILNPNRVIADKIKADYNIARGWGLANIVIPTKAMIFSSKTKMKELATKGDFDEVKKIISISYNDDTNVALFAENLKDRVAAFNWKLKNNYYIFGMRKGINEIICKNLCGQYFSGRKLVKTILDKKELDRLFEKMTAKFFDTGMIQSNTVIDFKTGKPKNTDETSIIIALPYDLRVKEDITPFLELIWNIENEKITPETFRSSDNLSNDSISAIPLEERGEIYRILTKQVTVPPENLVFANEDMHKNKERIRELATEQRNSFMPHFNDQDFETNDNEETDNDEIISEEQIRRKEEIERLDRIHPIQQSNWPLPGSTISETSF